MNLQDKFMLLGMMEIFSDFLIDYSYRNTEDFNEAYDKVRNILKDKNGEDLLREISPDIASDFREEILYEMSSELADQIKKEFKCLRKKD